MPKGLDTCLYKDLDEDGVTISGGEAQKIAIARALYKDAPFIVLDEPTAALDPVAEAEIYAKFNEIAGDKTAIYISHRLSSCKFCDEIAVFDHGEVVQQGTHEELLGGAGWKVLRTVERPGTVLHRRKRVNLASLSGELSPEVTERFLALMFCTKKSEKNWNSRRNRVRKHSTLGEKLDPQWPDV